MSFRNMIASLRNEKYVAYVKRYEEEMAADKIIIIKEKTEREREGKKEKYVKFLCECGSYLILISHGTPSIEKNCRKIIFFVCYKDV